MNTIGSNHRNYPQIDHGSKDPVIRSNLRPITKASGKKHNAAMIKTHKTESAGKMAAELPAQIPASGANFPSDDIATVAVKTIAATNTAEFAFSMAELTLRIEHFLTLSHSDAGKCGLTVLTQALQMHEYLHLLRANAKESH